MQTPPDRADLLPSWLILGAPKAGTTALAGWLAAHPGVHVAAGKEVRYFNLHYDRGLVWYQLRLGGGEPGQAVGEATPGYLYDDAALDRIHALVPDVRLLVLLRDPVARAWSHYWFNRASGIEARTFERALADEANGRAELVHRYVWLGRYVDRLIAVTERFAREQLLVLYSSALREDPAGVFAAVCRHLGVDDSIAPPREREANVGGTPRSITLQRVLRRTRADRWPGGLGRRAINASVRSGVPAIDPEVAARLREDFAEDDGRLADWLGEPLPWRC